MLLLKEGEPGARRVIAHAGLSSPYHVARVSSRRGAQSFCEASATRAFCTDSKRGWRQKKETVCVGSAASRLGGAEKCMPLVFAGAEGAEAGRSRTGGDAGEGRGVIARTGKRRRESTEGNGGQKARQAFSLSGSTRSACRGDDPSPERAAAVGCARRRKVRRSRRRRPGRTQDAGSRANPGRSAAEAPEAGFRKPAPHLWAGKNPRRKRAPALAT